MSAKLRAGILQADARIQRLERENHALRVMCMALALTLVCCAIIAMLVV